MTDITMTAGQQRLRCGGYEADGYLISDPMSLQPEWIDFNGHLNMAFYSVLFDLGCTFAFDRLGLGADFRKGSGMTSMTADFRIRYIRELMPEDRVQATFRVIDVGPKSFHFVQELRHVDGWLSATAENINLSVDAAARRVAPYPPDRLEALTAMQADHDRFPRPDWVSAAFGVRK